MPPARRCHERRIEPHVPSWEVVHPAPNQSPVAPDDQTPYASFPEAADPRIVLATRPQSRPLPAQTPDAAPKFRLRLQAPLRDSCLHAARTPRAPTRPAHPDKQPRCRPTTHGKIRNALRGTVGRPVKSFWLYHNYAGWTNTVQPSKCFIGVHPCPSVIKAPVS